MVRILAVLAMSCAVGILAPAPFAAGQEPDAEIHAPGPRKQIAVIIFSGLAGAVLGLSTLSFYGRPQEKLSNIGMGAAIGVIIGAGYTTYKAATQPRGYYGAGLPEIWVIADQSRERPRPQPVGAAWTWSF